MSVVIEFNTAAILAAVDAAADDAAAETALAIENTTKAETPVRGAYRSFRPKDTNKGGDQIGGALRRSYTTAPPGGVGDAAGGGSARRNVRNGGILVGSWLGYAFFVDRGTVKMPARPHFTPAIARELPGWVGRFERAYERHARRSLAG